jgi:hypothetical protein
MFAYACHASPRPTEDVFGVPGEGGQAQAHSHVLASGAARVGRRASLDSSSSSRLARCCWPWPASSTPGSDHMAQQVSCPGPSVRSRPVARGLSKDHAVAALHVCATPISEGVGTPLCWTQLSSSAGPARLCRGCSRPPRRSPAQAASSFTPLLRQQGDGRSPTPIRVNSASWRTARLRRDHRARGIRAGRAPRRRDHGCPGSGARSATQAPSTAPRHRHPASSSRCRGGHGG